MATYKAKKLSVIQAEQFLPPNQIPKGVINVYQMGVGTPENPTWFSGEVCTIQGEKVRVKHGEWIVQESGDPNRYYPIGEHIFLEKYELMNTPTQFDERDYQVIQAETKALRLEEFLIEKELLDEFEDWLHELTLEMQSKH